VPPTVEDRLLDILEAIAEVDGILVAKTLEQFTSDRMLRLRPSASWKSFAKRHATFLIASSKMRPTSTGERWSISAIDFGMRIMKLMSLLFGRLFRSTCRR
jgi:hypothetical protein